MQNDKLFNALIQIAAINPGDKCTATDLSHAVREIRRLALAAIGAALNGNQTGHVVRTGPELITRVSRPS